MSLINSTVVSVNRDNLTWGCFARYFVSTWDSRIAAVRFHRSESKVPGGRCSIHQRIATLLRELQNAACVAEKSLSGRRKHHATLLPNEQLLTQLSLELFHPHGDIGLHGVHFVRRRSEAALFGHSTEDSQLTHFHDGILSITENDEWRSAMRRPFTQASDRC
jgi:hypothetical protein